MGYGSEINKDSLQGGDFAPRITDPYLGPAKLVTYKSQEIKKESTGEEWNILNFEFLLLDDDVKGLVHQTALYEPDPTDDDKIDKSNARIGYILKYFVGEDNAINCVNAATSWANLCINVGKVLEHTRSEWENKIVTIKVLGSVYQGKNRLDFPGYKGFITDENSEKQLTWGIKELKSNQDYLAAINTPASTSEEVAKGSSTTGGKTLGF